MRALVATGVLFGVCLSLGSLASDARADNPDPGALFDKGLADMQAHQYATGCPALAESYRLDPHAGGLFTLAECESDWGKIASAIADYDGFLDMYSHLPASDRQKQGTRAKVAAEKRTALAREVPKLTLTLDHDFVAGSAITLDTKSVPEALFHTTIPVDPGAHTVVLHAPDGRSAEQHVTVALGETRAVQLTLVNTPVAGAGATPVPAPGEPTEPSPAPAKPESHSTRDAVVYTTGGVGAAALVAGLVIGGIVLGDKSTIDKNCPTATTCANASDASSANGATTLGWVSTAAVAVGGAAIVAAIAIRIKWPKSNTSSVSASFQPSNGGGVVGLGGAW